MPDLLRRASVPLLLLSGIALVLVAGGRAPSAGVAPGRTAIHGVRLFDGAAVVENATVVFDESGILEVCAACPEPEGARLIDGAGRTLLPGLIDAHTHAFGDALERAVVFGVTTEIDMFTASSFAAERRAEQRRGQASGRADLVSAGTLVTVAGGHGTEYGLPIPTLEAGADAQAFVDARLAEGSEFIKIVYDDGAAFGLRFRTLTPERLREVIEAAHARGRRAVVHASTAAAARTAVEAGADGLVHAWSDAPGDESLAGAIAAKKVFVIPTLTVLSTIAGSPGEALARDPALSPYLNAREQAALTSRFPGGVLNEAALGTGREIVRRLHARGVTLLAGTDASNPGTAHGVSLHGELALLTAAGLTPLEALRSATSVPAATFGLERRGRIAPGMRADLLLVEGNPLRDIAATRRIAGVWKEGREVRRALPVAAPAPKATVPGGMVSDFEQDNGSAFGTAWTISTDRMMGGSSSGELARVPGRGGHVLQVRGNVAAGSAYPWSGAMLLLSGQPMHPVDLRPLHTLSFLLRSSAPVVLMVFSESRGRVPVTRQIPPAADWTGIRVPLAELGLDGSDIQGILVSGTRGEFSFELDDVRLQ